MRPPSWLLLPAGAVLAGPAPLLAAAALVALGATVARVALPPPRTAEVAVPARDASPHEVVRSYLAAIDAHDCTTAEALVEPRMAGDARKWCEDAAGLDAPAVRAAYRESPQMSGHAAPDEVANVAVAFGLRWRAFHGDSSMPEGRTVWGYLLVRHAASGPWRIFDQGVG